MLQLHVVARMAGVLRCIIVGHRQYYKVMILWGNHLSLLTWRAASEHNQYSR